MTTTIPPRSTVTCIGQPDLGEGTVQPWNTRTENNIWYSVQWADGDKTLHMEHDLAIKVPGDMPV